MNSSPYNNPMALAVDNAFLTNPTNVTSSTDTQLPAPERPPEEPIPVVLPAATKTERFFLTAADQASGTRNERLNMVIRSKYEAGLLKPYNYVKGYARLSRWMDRKCVIAPPHSSHMPMTNWSLQRVFGVEGQDPAAVVRTPAEVQSEPPGVRSGRL